jgi:hypothetical protein
VSRFRLRFAQAPRRALQRLAFPLRNLIGVNTKLLGQLRQVFSSRIAAYAAFMAKFCTGAHRTYRAPRASTARTMATTSGASIAYVCKCPSREVCSLSAVSGSFPHVAGSCRLASVQAAGWPLRRTSFRWKPVLRSSQLSVGPLGCSGSQQLARLAVALPDLRQRHVWIPAKGHQLFLPLKSIRPTPACRPRARPRGINSRRRSSGTLCPSLWLYELLC